MHFPVGILGTGRARKVPRGRTAEPRAALGCAPPSPLRAPRAAKDGAGKDQRGTVRWHEGIVREQRRRGSPRAWRGGQDKDGSTGLWVALRCGSPCDPRAAIDTPSASGTECPSPAIEFCFGFSRRNSFVSKTVVPPYLPSPRYVPSRLSPGPVVAVGTERRSVSAAPALRGVRSVPPPAAAGAPLRPGPPPVQVRGAGLWLGPPPGTEAGPGRAAASPPRPAAESRRRCAPPACPCAGPPRRRWPPAWAGPLPPPAASRSVVRGPGGSAPGMAAPGGCAELAGGGGAGPGAAARASRAPALAAAEAGPGPHPRPAAKRRPLLPSLPGTIAGCVPPLGRPERRGPGRERGQSRCATAVAFGASGVV